MADKKYRDANKEKIKIYNKEYRSLNKQKRLDYQAFWRTAEWRRNYHLKYIFKITQDRYDEILKSQKGVCKICLGYETRTYKKKVRNLAIDHNHDTGEIRGLLCGACNTALGLFKDSPELLQRAKEYLHGNT